MFIAGERVIALTRGGAHLPAQICSVDDPTPTTPDMSRTKSELSWANSAGLIVFVMLNVMSV